MLRQILKSDWDPSFRMIYRFFLLLLTVSLLLYLIAFFTAPYNGLEWYVTATTEIVKIPLHQFSLGLFTVDLLADNFLIKQYFEGSPFQFEAIDTYLYLAFLALGLTLLLSIITYFSTFWFTLSMGIFTVLLISMQWQQLLLFGFTGREPLIAIAALFLGVSFYFQALYKNAHMIIRLSAFTLLFGVIAIIISTSSGVSNPFLHLAHYGIFIGVLLTLLFIFFIAHEIVYLILYLITQARPDNRNRNAVHFFVFSIIYLGNIFLIYLRNGGYIDWDILYVNAFVLILISFGVALWSFEKKEEAYSVVFSYNPLGGLFLLALAIIAFAAIRYQLVMANDPLLETFEDAIIFSHLGFGFMFFVYVIANFITPLIRNLQVYKVVYKEGNFPYATATLASLVVVLTLYFIANQAPLNQAVAGYYNLVGDLYLRNEPNVARQFYIQGTNYGYNNHRSYYRLAILDQQERKPARAIVNYNAAIAKHPTPHAYINLSNAYRQENLYFDALFTLQEAVNKFPNDGSIKNNLGLLFSETEINDSTLFYLNQVQGNSRAESIAGSNKTGFYAKKLIRPEFDSLAAALETNDYVPSQANMLGLANRFALSLPAMKFRSAMMKDSLLNAYTLPLVVNAFTARLPQDSVLAEGLLALTNYPGNARYEEWLLYSRAWQNYQRGDISSAFKQMDGLSFQSDNIGQYQRTLGLLAMEQNAPELAVEYLNKAFDNGVRDTVNLMLANLEAGKVAVAFGLMQGGVAPSMVSDINFALSASKDQLMESEDRLKYLALRYRFGEWDMEDIKSLLETFTTDEFQQNSILLSTFLSAKNQQYEAARELLNLIDQPTTSVLGQWQNLTMLLNIIEGNKASINGSFDQLNKPYEDLMKAHLAVVSGDTALASQRYVSLASNNPFFIWGCLQAVEFFNASGDEFEAYEILRNAIDVNKYSVPLIKAFVRQATAMRLDNYADTAILRLLDLIEPTDYNTFEQEINTLRNEVRESSDDLFDL